MADSRIVQLADAIVDDLNAAGGFGETFAAARRFLPYLRAQDMGTATYVTVVPRESTLTRASRSQSTKDMAVDVAVQEVVDDPNADRIDQLLAFAEALADHMDGRQVSTGHRIIGIETEPIYDPDHLQRHIFTAVITARAREVA